MDPNNNPPSGETGSSSNPYGMVTVTSWLGEESTTEDVIVPESIIPNDTAGTTTFLITGALFALHLLGAAFFFSLLDKTSKEVAIACLLLGSLSLLLAIDAFIMRSNVSFKKRLTSQYKSLFLGLIIVSVLLFLELLTKMLLLVFPAITSLALVVVIITLLVWRVKRSYHNYEKWLNEFE